MNVAQNGRDLNQTLKVNVTITRKHLQKRVQKLVKVLLSPQYPSQ